MYSMEITQPAVVEEVSSGPTFEQQTEKLLTSCTIDQLEYLNNAIYAEKEFRKFSETKVMRLS